MSTQTMLRPTQQATRPSPRWIKARRRLAGVAFLLVMALLAWLSTALYQKQFTPVAMVTLYSGSAGSEMHPGAQVMVRGVQVGEVRQISAAGSGARMQLALQPGALPRLPANVSAELLPTTLFGERYVDLILPGRPSAQTLTSGSVIRQNRSRDSVELESVLNNLLPTLRAVEPDKLSVVLTVLAQGLQGRGHKLGQTLVTLDNYLRKLNPHLPALDRDINELAGFARTYTQASPSILQALSDFTITNQTIASERANLAALFATVTTASGNLHAFLSANSSNMIKLSTDSLPTLRILARYAPEFPCLLGSLARFVPTVNKVLGKGTNQPGLHAQVIVVPSRGRYLPGKNTPVFGDNSGPHCYPVPFPGISLNDGAGGPAGSAQAPSSASKSAVTRAANTSLFSPTGPAGLAGSPAESELVRELAGLSLKQPPRSLPSWSGLLVAPLFRGSRVMVR